MFVFLAWVWVIGGTAAFPSATSVTSLRPNSSSSSLDMSIFDDESSMLGGKRMAATILTSAFLLVGLFVPDDALAIAPHPLDAAFDSSTVTLSARSGGRMGGRAGGGGFRAPSRGGRSSSRYYSPSMVGRPTGGVVGSPGVILSPFGYGGGFGFPFGGFGLGYGLGGGMGGSAFRDYRQEAEIRQEQSELQQERSRSAELEARLQALEMQQQAGQGSEQKAPSMQVKDGSPSH